MHLFDSTSCVNDLNARRINLSNLQITFVDANVKIALFFIEARQCQCRFYILAPVKTGACLFQTEVKEQRQIGHKPSGSQPVQLSNGIKINAAPIALKGG